MRAFQAGFASTTKNFVLLQRDAARFRRGIQHLMCVLRRENIYLQCKISKLHTPHNTTAIWMMMSFSTSIRAIRLGPFKDGAHHRTTVIRL